MTIQRLYHSIRLLLCRSYRSRAEYLKKNEILGEIGNNCAWGPWLLPLYPKLIHLHNNVEIHKTCVLIPHDDVNKFLDKAYPEKSYKNKECLGCIELMDNVLLSINTVVMPNVRINKNCIISAGSIVTTDIPENSIASGIPATPVGKTNLYAAIRKWKDTDNYSFSNQHLPDETAEEVWKNFLSNREQQT